MCPHKGPFSEEGLTIEKVHSFIEEKGNLRRGKDHGIYLSDIRRATTREMENHH